MHIDYICLSRVFLRIAAPVRFGVVRQVSGAHLTGSRLPGIDRGTSLACTRAPVEMRKILWTFCEFPRITSTPVDPSPKFPHGGQIMRTNRFAIFTTALLFVALALSVGAGAADQHSGTWKMNPAKSKYSPGPVPKSTTVKIESDADNIKLSSDGIDAAGIRLTSRTPQNTTARTTRLPACQTLIPWR